MPAPPARPVVSVSRKTAPRRSKASSSGSAVSTPIVSGAIAWTRDSGTSPCRTSRCTELSTRKNSPRSFSTRIPSTSSSSGTGARAAAPLAQRRRRHQPLEPRLERQQLLVGRRPRLAQQLALEPLEAEGARTRPRPAASAAGGDRGDSLAGSPSSGSRAPFRRRPCDRPCGRRSSVPWSCGTSGRAARLPDASSVRTSRPGVTPCAPAPRRGSPAPLPCPGCRPRRPARRTTGSRRAHAQAAISAAALGEQPVVQPVERLGEADAARVVVVDEDVRLVVVAGRRLVAGRALPAPSRSSPRSMRASPWPLSPSATPRSWRSHIRKSAASWPSV